MSIRLPGCVLYASALVWLAGCSVPIIPATMPPPALTLSTPTPQAKQNPNPTPLPQTPPTPGNRVRPPNQSTPPRGDGSANCANTFVGFTPLIDLGIGTYKGFEGGLYPSGSNQPPATYLQAGLARAQAIQPLDREGRPDATGIFVLLSIGMSNTTQEFSEFKREADVDAQKNPQLVIVDGAQGGQDAGIVMSPSARFWNVVEQRLQQAGVSGAQVQSVWLKEAIAGPRENFPTDAQRLQKDLQAIVQILARRYPNLQIIYLSSRTYAGYATTQLNPEPYAYQSGFAVKWLIEDQIKNGAQGPWLAWGPYLWTDGTKGRSDGFIWECKDTRSDGTHPSPTSGVHKVAGLLLNFFKNDQTAKSWFVKK